MKRAIFLAKKGQFSVAPNPLVGAVVVHDGEIIGEGYHAKYGEAHAEVNAIESVKNKDLLVNSTIYVTLEPCSHQGKTPPCVDLILNYKIPRVVIANRDPFDKVNGSGIDKLKASGVEVSLGIMENEGKELNRRFFTFHGKKRPYIILKWAETSDGFISREKSEITNSNNWITNPISKQLVHQWRAEEQGILIGKNTASIDDPALTCREVSGKNPIRIVIDSKLELDSGLKIFNSEANTIVLNHVRTEQKGNIEFIKLNKDLNFFESTNQICVERNIQSILVEGGKHTLETWINNQWDEARVFTGSVIFKTGIKAPLLNEKEVKSRKIDSDLLSIYRNNAQ